MKMLTNPAVVQMVGLFILIGGTLIFGFLVIRGLRKNVTEDLEAIAAKPRADTPIFALATYQGVIAGLKEREQLLNSQLSAEAKRSAMLETVSSAILDNVSTGVVMFSSNLMVQQANPAARAMLGYASPVNMHIKEVFRGLQTVELPSSNGALGGISQAVRDVFSNSAEYRDVPAAYSTPGGEARHFMLALLPIRDPAQQVLKTLCLITPSDTAFTLSFPAAEAGRKSTDPE